MESFDIEERRFRTESREYGAYFSEPMSRLDHLVATFEDSSQKLRRTLGVILPCRLGVQPFDDDAGIDDIEHEAY